MASICSNILFPLNLKFFFGHWPSYTFIKRKPSASCAFDKSYLSTMQCFCSRLVDSLIIFSETFNFFLCLKPSKQIHKNSAYQMFIKTVSGKCNAATIRPAKPNQNKTNKFYRSFFVELGKWTPTASRFLHAFYEWHDAKHDMYIQMSLSFCSLINSLLIN